MIAWMLYLTLVGVLVALAARSAESIGRALGYPVRWVWTGALIALAVFAAAAPLRNDVYAPIRFTVREAEVAAASPAPSPTFASRVKTQLAGMGAAMNDGVKKGVQRIDQALPKNAALWLLALSVGASASVLLVLTAIQLRFRRARHKWPIADVQGVRVRLSPNIGPIVIGVARPEIVVPHWLLGRSDHEQHLVVTHEAEHVQARDTLLLGAACLVVAAMPWNPVVWYMLSRLRLTIELDCDARVLRTGAAPYSYGSLLIDVAESNAGFRLSTPALADDSSHLHQRIMAMNAIRPKFILARGGVLGALALAAVLAACEAKMPTSAEVDQMDAASADRVATKLAMVKSDSLVYIVDGVRTSGEKAKAIAAAEIATVEVKKGEGAGYIIMRTKGAGERDSVRLNYSLAKISADTAEVLGKKRGMEANGNLRAAPPPPSANPTEILYKKSEAMANKPLVYIDGVKRGNDAMKSLNPSDILSVEVIKGAAAAAYVNDPDAANGVIVIKTKKG